jgi:hypothetical protein
MLIDFLIQLDQILGLDWRSSKIAMTYGFSSKCDLFCTFFFTFVRFLLIRMEDPDRRAAPQND